MYSFGCFKGCIRIPIAQVLANQRACSGFCKMLPSALSQSVVAEDKNYSSTKDIQLSDHSE